jgi:AAHS family 4-hydroxybenzoate transporter-like MFS transporter
MNHTIDVANFVDSRPISPYQWLILAICTLIAAVDGLDVAILSFLVPSLAHDWGVPKAAFGLVIGAGLFGVAVGALAVGPVSDRKGRKTVILIAMALCAIGTFGCAGSHAPAEMSVWRFFTGIGLGAALPNATTVLAEYSPQRHRARLIAVMFVGFSLGAASAGFTAAQLLPWIGWKGMLVLGAVLPVLCAVLVATCLPESVRFLVVRGAPSERVARILSRLSSARLDGATRFTLPELAGVRHTAIAGLFKGGLGLGSALLWVAYFMGLLVYYLLTSWLPSLIVQTGQPIEKAAVVSALLLLGASTGTLLMGWLMDRLHPTQVVATAFALGAGLLYYVGRGLESFLALQVCVFLAGLFISGALSSMNTLAAMFYPTQSRASGVSWMLGIGRFGGILGAMGGGWLLAAGWDISRIFMTLAVPALAAGVALAAKGLRYAQPPQRLPGDVATSH